jgi:hypothetical protein
MYGTFAGLCRDGILERHFLWKFLGINSSFLRLEFLSGCFLPLFIRSLSIHENNRVFLFRGFFSKDFLNPPGEGTLNSMEQKTRVFCYVQEFHLRNTAGIE